MPVYSASGSASGRWGGGAICAQYLCTLRLHNICAEESCTTVLAGQQGFRGGSVGIWVDRRAPVDLVTVVPCASDRGRRSRSGARGIPPSTLFLLARTPDAYLHPEAGRDHARVARDRRDRRRARPPREPD